MIISELFESVLIVRLNHGKTNAINFELVQALTETIQEVKNNNEIGSLVITSMNDKFFSIGFDIPSLINLSRSDFEHFYLDFNRMCLDLYTLSKPTIAAITGHAIAGGTILTLCCDYRFIGKGRKLMGLNEIKLGVPVPYLADCVLHSIVGTVNAQKIMEGGAFYTPGEALNLAMVDGVFPDDEVLRSAIEKVNLLSAYPPAAFAMIKQNRTEALEDRISKNMKRKAEHFISCWFSDESRELLIQAMEKF